MARIRTIKPEFPQSESMGRVSRDARLCFIMLWTIADDSGRLRGNSRMLASLLYPYDDDAKALMDGWLGELEKEGCITRYSVNSDSYVEVSGWQAHQKIDRPSASKIPAPIESSRDDANPREPSSEDLRTKDQGKDQGGDSAAASPPGRKTGLPQDFAVSESVKAWAKVKGYTKLGEHLDSFKRKATAKGYVNVDWDAAFMDAIEEDWAKLRGRGPNGIAPTGESNTVPMRPDALFKPAPALTPEQLAANRANADAQFAKLKTLRQGVN